MIDSEVRPCREVVLEPPDLTRAVTRLEKECVQVQFDRMDRDHAKRCPRPRLSRPPILDEKLCREPILIGKSHHLSRRCSLSRVKGYRFVIHGIFLSTAFANDY